MNDSRYVIIFLALFCWGTYSLFLKIAINEIGHPIFCSLISFVAAALTILAVTLLFSDLPKVSLRPLLFLTIGGMLLGVGTASFLVLLEKMPVSVARPLLGLNILIAVLTGVFVLGETLTISKWIGIALALVAIGLLSI